MDNRTLDNEITRLTGRTAHEDFELTTKFIKQIAELLNDQPAYLVMMVLARMAAQVSVQNGVPREVALQLIGDAPDWALGEDLASIIEELMRDATGLKVGDEALGYVQPKDKKVH